jgi:uncharacterized protein YdgA (DUF945 family)
MRARRLTILFGAIVALSAITPGLLGMQAQRQYDHYVDQLQRAGYQITDRTYARGWFSADASFTAALPVPADADATPPALRFRSRIVHGPFLGSPRAFGLARIDSELRVGEVPLLVGDGTPPVRTVVGPFGDTDTVIDMPARQASFEEGALQIESGALTGELRLTADGSGAKGHLALPLLRLTGSDGERVEVADMRLEGGMRRSASGLALGEWKMTVGAIDGRQADAELRLEGLELAARSDEQEGFVSGSADYRLQRIVADGTAYGPLDIRVSASRLSAEALARLQQAMEDAGAASEEMRAQAAVLALLSNADALLAGDPAIALERLQVDTPEGRLDAQLELRAAGLRVAQMKDAAGALRRIEGKASLRVPEGLLLRFLEQRALQELAEGVEEGAAVAEGEIAAVAAEAARQQVASLVAQEVLVREGTQLAAAALWRNGLLTVNGKTVPLTLPAPMKP